MSWKYYNPVRIVYSDRFIDVLKSNIDTDAKILLICEDRLIKTSEFESIKESFTNFHIFTEIEPNPSFVSIDKAIKFSQNLSLEVILAIGGGSVIDTAKILRKALITGLSTVKKIVGSNAVIEKEELRFITIPTTHGTSSELTKWATVWNKKIKKKYSVTDDANYPELAIYDYHFVESLPVDISQISALDALSHSFEALWSKHANPISDEYAIKAIVLIMSHYNELNDSITKETRRTFLYATMYSGLAFSNTKTAAAHSISYPLTAHYHVPHGIACSVTLPFLLDKVKNNIQEKISRICNAMNYKNYQELYLSLLHITSTDLSKYGINAFNIDLIVEYSNTKNRMDNYLIKLSDEEIKHILKKVL
jgi:alcohol dehydrogenase class IV